MKKIDGAPVCPYCSKPSVLTSGAEVYPHVPSLSMKPFYVCRPCDASVGCHPGTVTPLGRLADAQLRRAKSDAHRLFDPLWQKGKMKRTAAYRWLAQQMRVDPKDCHIGMFDSEQCRRVAQIRIRYRSRAA